MKIVHELLTNDQRTEGPGIYLLASDRFTFGLKPERSKDGKEMVPFEWATEFPPVGEFVKRFPAYWIANRESEHWVSEHSWNPVGIFWCRFDPKALIR